MAAKVYYNSACPVCDAGIKDQRARMAACGATDVEWIDVHAEPARAAEVGATLEEVRERLHVREDDGSVGVGAEAFARLWERTAGQGWLASLVRLPILSTLARLAYNAFARGLYRWNRARGRW
jgi:predicted DCC family thiol-disulfide oxidoreductase YuxK